MDPTHVHLWSVSFWYVRESTHVLPAMVSSGRRQLPLFLVVLVLGCRVRAMTRGEFDSWWDSWRTRNDLTWSSHFCRQFPYYTDCTRYWPEKFRSAYRPQDVRRISAASNPCIYLQSHIRRFRLSFLFTGICNR